MLFALVVGLAAAALTPATVSAQAIEVSGTGNLTSTQTVTKQVLTTPTTAAPCAVFYHYAVATNVVLTGIIATTPDTASSGATHEVETNCPLNVPVPAGQQPNVLLIEGTYDYSVTNVVVTCVAPPSPEVATCHVGDTRTGDLQLHFTAASVTQPAPVPTDITPTTINAGQAEGYTETFTVTGSGGLQGTTGEGFAVGQSGNSPLTYYVKLRLRDNGKGKDK